MKAKTISHTLDTLPPLTEAQEAHLKALATRPESEIDYSDITAMSEAQFRHARRGVFYRPVKRQITARVDADVLDWLKAQGKGYQSRINAILRREMLAAAKQKQKAAWAKAINHVEQTDAGHIPVVVITWRKGSIRIVAAHPADRDMRTFYVEASEADDARDSEDTRV